MMKGPLLLTALLAACLAGCAVPAPYSPPSAPAPASARGSAAGTAAAERPTAPPLSVESPTRGDSPGAVSATPPAAAASRPTFTLGPASQSLVAQARAQADAGDFAVAAGTVERALRIESDNPLLWIELARIRLAEGNAGQAESLGRKAVSLAAGDTRAEASAWQIVADSLRQSGRTAESIEAEARARTLRAR